MDVYFPRTLRAVFGAWAIGLILLQGTIVRLLGEYGPNYPFVRPPVLGAHVAWDSEHYLAIAVDGYEAEGARTWPTPQGEVKVTYGFFPLYPLLTRVAARPAVWCGVDPFMASTATAVMLSLLGAALAAGALCTLAGERAGHYLLLFPSGFYLAQVYSESVFLALALWCVVALRRERYVVAAALAAAATMTRATGFLLALAVVPSIWRGRWRALFVALAAGVTIAAWQMSHWGRMHAVILAAFWQREVGALDHLSQAVASGAAALPGGWANAFYVLLDWGAVALGVIACAREGRRHPDLAFFGLGALLLPLSTGHVYGEVRYALACAPIFVWLGDLGQHPTFDRAWIIVTTIVMALCATLFTVELWVA